VASRRERLPLGLAGLAGCLAGALAALLAKTLPPQGLVVVVLALVLLFAAASAGRLRSLLLAFVLIDIPFQWDKNFGFRQSAASLDALAGWSVSVTTIALAGLYSMWIARLLVLPERTPRPRIRAAGAGLAFVGFMFASVAVASDRTMAGFELFLLAQLLLLFVYVASTVRSERELRFVAVLLLSGLALESLVALAIYASGGGFDVAGLASHHGHAAQQAGGTRRVGGTVGSANEAGSYFAFLTVVALALFLTSEERRLKRLALGSGILGLVALVATLSRGGWIAFLVGSSVLLFGLRAPRHLRVPRKALVGVAVTFLLALAPLSGVVSARVMGSDHGAAAGRVPLMELAWRMIGDHPLQGVGANNFVVALPHYADASFSRDWVTTVHNKYLLVWSEAGIGALVAFLLFIATTIRRGWRGRHQPERLRAGLSLGLGAAVAGLAVHMNFDIFQGRPMNELLWLAAALIAAMGFMARRETG
jgi:putative inorganic carbon (HCO3(-)) transporter